MSFTSSIPSWLTQGIESLQAGNIDGWMRIYAPDAVHEFPFAPAGWMTVLQGRDAISAYMKQLPGRIRFGTLSNVRVREIGDELIIEATGHHRRVSDDSSLEISYVWFITLRSGQVTHFKDYMNPLQLLAI